MRNLAIDESRHRIPIAEEINSLETAIDGERSFMIIGVMMGAFSGWFIGMIMGLLIGSHW